MKVVCISDTHGLHEELLAATGIPDGDVLIHAGDFTDTGDRDEVLAFNAFLARLPHRYKLVVAGNHESTFDRAFYPAHWQQYGHRQAYDPDEVRALLTNALYLEDQAVVIDGFLFYGSPWQPEFCSWAFNLPRGPQLLDKWQRIPDAVDVLVTHTPPLGRGDQVGHLRVGCADLLREVQSRIRPQFHVFGHVHEGYGSSSDGVTTFLNASSCTHEYEAVNPPMVLDLRTPRTACIPADLTARWRYEVLLHEQLRVCSQKPAFVPKPLAAGLHRAAGVVSAPAECIDPHSPSDAHPHGARKASLREFRVDGTTAALLFESTLKLRPVVGEQTRALRYLFHQGFRHGAPGAAAVGTTEDGSVLARGHLEDDGLDAVHVEDGDVIDDEADEAANADGQASESQRRRRRRARSEDRRPSLTRRVTFAVLKEVLDTRPSDPLIPVDAQAKALNGQDAASTEKPIARRRRPDKSLRRREAVARLAPMMEEPEDGKEPEAKEPDRKVPDPPTVPVDCMLCKYKVAGHVHATDAAPSKPPAPSSTSSKPENDGSAAPEPTAQLQQPSVLAVAPPAPAVDCILCKYKVAGHKSNAIKSVVMGRSENPVEAYRREQKKKELKKHKFERQKVKHEKLAQMDPDEIRATQLKKMERQLQQNPADGPTRKRKQEMEEEQKEKKAADKSRVTLSDINAANRERYQNPQNSVYYHPTLSDINAANRERYQNPQNSVYYHPVLNPFGAPPPGRPQMYHVPPPVPVPVPVAAPPAARGPRRSAVPPPPPPPPKHAQRPGKRPPLPSGPPPPGTIQVPRRPPLPEGAMPRRPPPPPPQRQLQHQQVSAPAATETPEDSSDVVAPYPPAEDDAAWAEEQEDDEDRAERQAKLRSLVPTAPRRPPPPPSVRRVAAPRPQPPAPVPRPGPLPRVVSAPSVAVSTEFDAFMEEMKELGAFER
ncbi:hypothetical protein ATCC90586_003340 [Pythium insidiosum]|nr:hypothetical protein ATCC90586_003340 [Pythium insidiosum]